MADLTDIQAAQAVKLVGADAAGLEGTPVGADSRGNLQTIQKGYVSTSNSTTSLLGSGGTFTGVFEEILGIACVSVILFADQASATPAGLILDWSSDGTNIDDSDTFAIAANAGKQYTFGPASRYVRVRYVNGGVAQSTFRLQAIFHQVGIKPSSHRVADSIVDDDDAELAKAVITGKSQQSGNYINVAVDDEGRLVTSPISGFGADFTFGDVATATASLTAIRRTAYTEQTTNAQRSIASASANDTAAGTGARTVRVVYYDATGAGPFSETLTLNGTTGVNTVASNICYIENIQVLTVGSTGSNVGILTLYSAINKGGVTIGTIGATDNQTLWCHHYIPTGKISHITGTSISNNSNVANNGALFFLKAIAIGVANAVELQISDFVSLFGQSSSTYRSYTSPVVVSGPARVTGYVIPNNNNAQIQRMSFDYFEP